MAQFGKWLVWALLCGITGFLSIYVDITQNLFSWRDDVQPETLVGLALMPLLWGLSGIMVFRGISNNGWVVHLLFLIPATFLGLCAAFPWQETLAAPGQLLGRIQLSPLWFKSIVSLNLIVPAILILTQLPSEIRNNNSTLRQR
ncbi:hypothetical protein [Marinobacter lipolyticus]|uniref:hypothetical protein n=1 Tax=Marinobacter lipolyticus TaxID=209639 RepID=UPI003A93309E